jgi:hypothetical protein
VFFKLFFTRRAAARQCSNAAQPLTLESALTSATTNTSSAKSLSFTPVAVVTGGARGIGLACVKWFLAHGYQVAMLDTEAATLKQAEQALNDSARLLALHCDVSIPAQVQTAINQVEEKFGRKAVDGHRTRPDGTDLKWKQIGVKEIEESRELPFFIQWLTEDHPSKDGLTVSKIEKIVIADKDQLSDSWFKNEILKGLDKVAIDWVDPSTQDGETGIVSVHLSTPNGAIVLD